MSWLRPQRKATEASICETTFEATERIPGHTKGDKDSKTLHMPAAGLASHPAGCQPSRSSGQPLDRPTSRQRSRPASLWQELPGQQASSRRSNLPGQRAVSRHRETRLNTSHQRSTGKVTLNKQKPTANNQQALTNNRQFVDSSVVICYGCFILYFIL